MQLQAFLAVEWTGTALALCCLIVRLTIRWKVFKQLSLDDYMVILAWCTLLSANIIWNTEIRPYFDKTDKMPSAPLYMNKYVSTRIRTGPRFHATYHFLFGVSLWSVKLSFLAFFWKIVDRTQMRDVWWWTVTVITTTTFVAFVLIWPWECTGGSVEHLLVYCQSRRQIYTADTMFQVNTSFDFITDCLIISVAVRIIWPARIQWLKKLYLIAVFACVLFTMGITLLRIVIAPSHKLSQKTDLPWHWHFTWSIVEMCVSICVSCLISFHQLYVSNRSEDVGSTRSSGSSFRHILRSFFPLLAGNISFAEVTATSNSSTSVPLQAIYVSKDVSVSRKFKERDERSDSDYILCPLARAYSKTLA